MASPITTIVAVGTTGSAFGIRLARGWRARIVGRRRGACSRSKTWRSDGPNRFSKKPPERAGRWRLRKGNRSSRAWACAGTVSATSRQRQARALGHGQNSRRDQPARNPNPANHAGRPTPCINGRQSAACRTAIAVPHGSITRKKCQLEGRRGDLTHLTGAQPVEDDGRGKAVGNLADPGLEVADRGPGPGAELAVRLADIEAMLRQQAAAARAARRATAPARSAARAARTAPPPRSRSARWPIASA